MHTNKNDDLNLNNSHQTEMMEDNVKLCSSNNIQQQFKKSNQFKQLTTEEELRKLQKENQNFNILLNQSRSSHYERAMLEKRESFYDNYESNDTSYDNFRTHLRRKD